MFPPFVCFSTRPLFSTFMTWSHLFLCNTQKKSFLASGDRLSRRRRTHLFLGHICFLQHDLHLFAFLPTTIFYFYQAVTSVLFLYWSTPFHLVWSHLFPATWPLCVCFILCSTCISCWHLFCTTPCVRINCFLMALFPLSVYVICTVPPYHLVDIYVLNTYIGTCTCICNMYSATKSFRWWGKSANTVGAWVVTGWCWHTLVKRNLSDFKWLKAIQLNS